MIGGIGTFAIQSGRRLFDLVLPPRCKKCGALVVADDALCGDCWSALTFLGPPWCDRCGRPFEFDVGEGALCGACIADPPRYGRARAALAYDDASRDMILRFKHGGDESLARLFARWMVQAGEELFREPCLIVPVPLHPLRLIKRRFNQSALLAKEISRLTGHPWDPMLLERVRHTASQGELGRSARARNVRGAFMGRWPQDRTRETCRVTIVDDVITSGATVSACVLALNRLDIQSDVCTIARKN